MYRRRTFTLAESKASEAIRTKMTEAETMICKIGPCRERSLALTKLDEALMWANAAIAQAGVEDCIQ